MRNSISILALAVRGPHRHAGRPRASPRGLGGNAGGAVQAARWASAEIQLDRRERASTHRWAPCATRSARPRATPSAARGPESERAARLAQAQARKAQAMAECDRRRNRDATAKAAPKADLEAGAQGNAKGDAKADAKGNANAKASADAEARGKASTGHP
jgi:colicin import membrane protein